MFSLRITSQSLSLHLGNSPPCLEMGGARELLPEAVLQKSG